MSSAAFPKTVTRTGTALIVLWGLSLGLSYAPLGAAAIPIALVIAVTKAGLVAMFFMELLHESLSMKLTIFAAGALLAILIGLMVADVSTRETPLLLPFGAQPRSSELRPRDRP